jgi:serine/threonine protein kinase/class 3 adenylate cyclase
MNLGRYQLLTQLGAGKDGICYRGRDPRDDSAVEIRVLGQSSTRGDAWKQQTKRLRLAAMLDQQAALSIQELNLDHKPPFAVMEWVDGASLTSRVRSRLPLATSEVIEVGLAIGESLAAAHRLGLVHGRLSPGHIRATAGGQLKIDFTGLETNLSAEEVSGSTGDEFCRPPEQPFHGAFDAAGDVFGLGAVLYWLFKGNHYQQRPGADNNGSSKTVVIAPVARTPREGTEMATSLLGELLARLLAADPSDRPSAAEVVDHLAALRGLADNATPAASRNTSAAATQCTAADAGPPRQGSPALLTRVAPQTIPAQLGRFRLLEKVGEGGLGTVFRAEDTTDGSVVAIKMLQPHRKDAEQLWKRFYKEARLLAEVHNPYIANLIELNEDNGIPYLVLEYVPGKSLSYYLAENKPLEEKVAVSIMADVARALVDAHQRGILHRDIKPENILVLDPIATGGGSAEGTFQRPRIKLCDFGLARHVLQSASLNLTGEGTVGTPFYSSPEQCFGEFVDARSDVYSMGATLFDLLAGQPPFQADSVQALSLKHANEPLPSLQKLNPSVSPAVCQVVEKALAKHPGSRYDDALALLLDLERLLRGEPANIVVHPRLPACAPGRLIRFDWTWDLQASPEQLWPHVSNTDRLNKAVGIPAVQFTSEANPEGGARRFGRFKKAGFTNVWQEHPFEWVAGQRMGVLREYSEGVFKWLATMTELKPRGGGTSLTHQVRIEPRGWLGRLVAAMEVGVKGRRIVERVYRRIDAYVTSQLQRAPGADPFEKPASLSRARQRRLDPLLDRLVRCQVDPHVVERLGDFLAHASPQEVARIRPLALAQRLELDPVQVVNACLLGAREGLLVLLWDILCPVCRIPSTIQDTLRALANHGHCEACNLDFELDFANSVEMIFRVHPEIRVSELGTYCIGGPAHSPHVVAQIRVAPGECMELDLGLSEGAYRLRGPQLPFALDFRVQGSVGSSRWDVRLARGSALEAPPALKTGRQRLVVTNDHTHELLVRVERTLARANALSGTRAATLPLFRELFPGEILSPGQLVSVATVTLLVTDVEHAADLYQQLGDGRAFGLIHEHFRSVDQVVRREGGALIKTVGEGAVAAFTDPVAAVRSGLELCRHAELESAASPGPARAPFQLRIAIHRGPALAATINDHLDYFGTMVSQATQLPQLIHGGEMVLSQTVTRDPQVASLLCQRNLALEVLAVHLPSQPHLFLHRLTASQVASASS